MKKPIVFLWPEDTFVVGVEPYLDGKVFVTAWDDEYIVDFAEQSVVSAEFYSREFVSFRHDRGWVKDKKIWRLLDGKGNEIRTMNDVRYRPAGPFSQDYCAIFERRTSLFRVMDKDGKMLLAPQLRWIGKFSKGFASAIRSSDDKYCIVNGMGGIVYTSDADELSEVRDGRCLEVWRANSVRKTDKIRLIECTKNGIRLLNEMEVPYKLKRVEEWRGGSLIPYYSEGIRRNQEGLLNISLRIQSDAVWDKAMYEREGFSRISSQGKVYFIDRMLEKLGEAGWEEAMDFSEGMAAVLDEKQKWGYINLAGKVAIEPRFDMGDRFFNGFAIVKCDGKFVLINQAGEVCTQVFDKLIRITSDHRYMIAEKDKKQYIVLIA